MTRPSIHAPVVPGPRHALGERALAAREGDRAAHLGGRRRDCRSCIIGRFGVSARAHPQGGGRAGGGDIPARSTGWAHALTSALAKPERIRSYGAA